LVAVVGKKASGPYTHASSPKNSSSKDRTHNPTINTFKVHSQINSTLLIITTSYNKSACVLDTLDILHARVGHTSFCKIQHIATCKPYLSKGFSCDTCVMAKFHKFPSNKKSYFHYKAFAAQSYRLMGSLQSN